MLNLAIIFILILNLNSWFSNTKLSSKLDLAISSCNCSKEEKSASKDCTHTTTTPTIPTKALSAPSKDINRHGYWMGTNAKGQHIFDKLLSKGLVEFFQYENVTSIIDLGAGMGNYSKEFMSQGIFTSCYDGNPSTNEISNGRCATIDLSREINFMKHDWVVSLEVGEHIPPQFESTFIRNLHRVNKHGMVISWAVVGQGGHGHVNNRDNSYLKQKICAMGYTYDHVTEQKLRNQSGYGWFKNTIMVFRKNVMF